MMTFFLGHYDVDVDDTIVQVRASLQYNTKRVRVGVWARAIGCARARAQT